MINSLSAHFSLSSLSCLRVSIFFLTLQLLLYHLLQSRYNPVVLILQAVAMEITVISQYQCCKHCRRQWKKGGWQEIQWGCGGQFKGVVSEPIFMGGFLLPLYYCGFSVCGVFFFCSFLPLFTFVNVFSIKSWCLTVACILIFCKGYYEVMLNTHFLILRIKLQCFLCSL